MIGGLIGACALAIPKAKQDGWLLTFVLVCFGVGFAMATSDYILVKFLNDRLFAHFTIAMGVGAIGGSMFVAIRAISPSFADKTVSILSTATTKALEAVVNSRIAKGISIIIGKGEDK